MRLNVETKRMLDSFREYKGESYDELIRKVTFISKLAGENLSEAGEVMGDVLKSRERIRSSGRYSKAEVKRILGEK